MLCVYFAAWHLSRFLTAHSGRTQPDSTPGQQQQQSTSAGGAAVCLKASCHATQPHCSSPDHQEAGQASARDTPPPQRRAGQTDCYWCVLTVSKCPRRQGQIPPNSPVDIRGRPCPDVGVMRPAVSSRGPLGHTTPSASWRQDGAIVFLESSELQPNGAPSVPVVSASLHNLCVSAGDIYHGSQMLVTQRPPGSGATGPTCSFALAVDLLN